VPGEVAVQAIDHSQAVAAGAVGAAAPAASTANASAQAAQPQKQESTSSTDPPVQSLYANPVSELDPALGIVVLHFYNAQGVQTSSIPSQKQLESYRLHDQTAAATSAARPTAAAPASSAAGASAGGSAAPAPPVPRPSAHAAPADTARPSPAAHVDTGAAAVHLDETGN
jgi:hypothetical protein